MRTSFVVAVIAIFAVASVVATDDALPLANFASSKVKVFDNNKALASALNGKKSVVCFFNARCTHCKSFAPEFVKAAEEAPKDVQYVAIDAELHGDIPAGFSFKYYPAVFWVDNNGNKVLYTDSRNAFSLANFVKGAANAPASFIEGVNIHDHYNNLSPNPELASDCKRSLATEAPTGSSLIESSETAAAADAPVPRHVRSVLDGFAYNGNEDEMRAREEAHMRTYMKSWGNTPAVPVASSAAEGPMFIAGQAIPASATRELKAAALQPEVPKVSNLEAHAETETETESEADADIDSMHGHTLAELEAEDQDMDMEIDM